MVIFGSHVFLGLLNGHLAATRVLMLLIVNMCQWLYRLVKNGRSALVVNFSDLNMILFSGVAHHAIST